jgi:ethanolaminephosphotransferase
MSIFGTESVHLEKDNLVALENYKYQGGDNGISYIWFHSPLAERVASMLPKTLAPNVVTLVAAMFLVVPHIVTILVYGTAFEGPINDWASVAVGVCHLIYITLDNVDGKQARRTGTSSPLGQMFDHGCDAITFSLGVMTVCRYRQLGSSFLTFAFICLSPTGYFTYNLKEYYMGEYYLPWINPVSEGSLLDFFVVLLCAYLGWETIQKPTSLGIRITELYIGVIVIHQIYQNIEMTIEILTAKKYDRPMKVGKFLVDFSSFYLLLTLGFISAIISPNDVVHDFDQGGRCILYVIMFGSSYLTIHLIVGHL